MDDATPASTPPPGREPDLSAEIDRITPTIRPRGRLVMHQKWRDLLFLHWPIAPELLRPLIPPQLDLDLHDGVAYVGLVPFRMVDVRPVGLPALRPISNFFETNVRTYVHCRGRDPGVWFFSLDAANALAVKVARAWFQLPYHFARLFLEEEFADSSRSGSEPGAPANNPILYAGMRRSAGSRPASYLIRAIPEGLPRSASPGTLEHFLVERYILYAMTGQKLLQGHVHHTPYPLQSAKTLCLDETLFSANDIQRASDSPISHFARGVNVKVFNLHLPEF